MNAKPPRAETDFAKTAKAVILYDHLETLLAANECVERVPLGVSQAAEWAVNSWRFDMLQLECGLEANRALEESADTELVLVTIRDPRAAAALPVSWLECWAALRRLRDAKLIVMPFDQAREIVENMPLVRVLRRMADFHHLAFSIFSDPLSGDGSGKEFKNATEWLRFTPQKRLVRNRAVPA